MKDSAEESSGKIILHSDEGKPPRVTQFGQRERTRRGTGLQNDEWCIANTMIPTAELKAELERITQDDSLPAGDTKNTTPRIADHQRITWDDRTVTSSRETLTTERKHQSERTRLRGEACHWSDTSFPDQDIRTQPIAIQEQVGQHICNCPGST
jgi:hypothetical protein